MTKKNASMARQARIGCEKFRSEFNQNIALYHTMHEFVLGQQWSKDEEHDMIKTYGKVPLTANKLATMNNSLIGEQQQNTPQIQVVPMAGCDEETAHLREIIVKDIIFSSDATTSMQIAAQQAAIGGYGALLVATDYSHEKSFHLDIVYPSINDATRCYWDLGAEKISKTDGMFCGYVTHMTHKKFKEVYGKDVYEDVMQSESITQSKQEIALAVQPADSENPFSWGDEESIAILNHFIRKYEKDTLYKLSNGVVLNQKEMDELIKESRKINARNAMIDMPQLQLPALDQMPEQTIDMSSQSQGGFGIEGDHDILPKENGLDVNEPKQAMTAPMEESEDRQTLWYNNEPVRINDSRPSKKHKIVHYQFAGDYELDKTDFPSYQLPLIFVDNNSYYNKAGKQVTRSFYGDCRDTQRYINYLRTQSAYILKISRYDQWIGSKKNVASLDTQNKWRHPTGIQGMLPFDESPSGIRPEQIKPPELSASLTQQYQLAIEDLYTCTGLYPARMGNNGDEASGDAIDARTRQGSYATFVFFNSINRAIATSGEIVNEMIPNVYDSERVLTLMMPDEGMKNITINREADEYGEKIENDIRKGTYQVRLKPGPSYEGQKQEALRSLREVLQVDPTAFNMVADLYADNLPLQNTIEIKNRLKTRVPPEIIEAGKTGKNPPRQGNSAEEQALAIQQQEMEVEAQYKQQQIQIKQAELQLKEKEMQAELEIEHMKLDIAKMELAGNIEEQRMRYMAETQRTQSDNAISHADNMVKILTTKVA